MKTKIELCSRRILDAPEETVAILLYTPSIWLKCETYFNKDIFRCTRDLITSIIAVEKVSVPYVTTKIYDARNRITMAKNQVKTLENEKHEN